MSYLYYVDADYVTPGEYAVGTSVICCTLEEALQERNRLERNEKFCNVRITDVRR